MQALLVCHAGKGVGLGHLSRMLTIAMAFRVDAHTKIELLIQGDSVKRSNLSSVSHRFISLDDSLEDAILHDVSFNHTQVIIFDIHPRFISSDFLNFLKRLHDLGIKLVGVDSLGHCEQCDIGYIPSFWVDPAKLEARKKPLFYGWDCYLLDKPKNLKTWEAGQNVLVLTGGSDMTHLGKSFPNELDEKLPLGAEINWVRGPYAEMPCIPDHPRLSWKIHEAPESLDEIMSRNHYAISIFGVTFFELLKRGIPTVVFSPYGDKDRKELEKIKREKISIVVENTSQAIDEILALMSHSKKAMLLSERAKNKIPSNGAEIFLNRIRSILNLS